MRVHGSRVPSFTTRVFTGFGEGKSSADETRTVPVEEGDVVMFDFGAVVDGYCSDFGRTVCVGEPGADVRDAYALVLAAQEAGLAALMPGVLASEVNRACRQPIEEAGYGPNFKHRMGHGIGLDVHERPFVSEEDVTPLEPGMTFTDEPSILVDGRFGVRTEDVVVCQPGGGRRLNAFPADADRQRLRQAHVDRVQRVEDRALQIIRRREDLGLSSRSLDARRPFSGPL